MPRLLANLRGAALLGLGLALGAVSDASTAASGRAPSIVEFGPTFRGDLGSLFVAGDGSIWVAEADGIAHILPDGRVVQRRLPDGDAVCPSTIGTGPGGAVWMSGCDRLQHFASGRWSTVDAGGSIDAFASTPEAVYWSRASEAGLRRADAAGHQTVLFPNVGHVEQIVVAPAGALWLLVTPPAGREQLVSVAADGSLKSGLGESYLADRDIHHAAPGADGSVLVDTTVRGTTALTQPPTIVRIGTDGAVRTIVELREDRGYSPVGDLAEGSDGAVWFTDPSANRVGRVSPQGLVREYRDGIPSGAAPAAIAVDRDGSAWASDSALGTVEHIGVDGSVHVVGNGLITRSTPGAAAATTDGAVWFFETFPWHERLARLAPDGTVREFELRLGPDAQSLQPQGHDVVFSVHGVRNQPMIVRVQPDGSLQQESTRGCLVSTNNVACFADRSRGVAYVSGLHTSADWVVRGPDGNLWFTDAQHCAIGRVSPSGTTTFTHGLTRWRSGPHYITNGPDGALWFTEMRDRVGRITRDGRITEFSAGLPFRSFPGGIVTGRDGNLWFTLYHGNELARITPHGQVTRFRDGIYPSSGNDDAIDSIPTLDARGRIWFNEPQGGRIARAVLP